MISPIRKCRTPHLPMVLIGLCVALTACDPGTGSVLAPADDAAAAEGQVPLAAAGTPMSARGSWNGWHIHDLAYGSEPYTDASGLRHEDFSIWPVIWPDYPSDESPVVYCTDSAEKNLVGGDGGAKGAAGTCRNSLYIIQIKLMASEAPAPAKWEAIDLGDGSTFYYRLTPR